LLFYIGINIRSPHKFLRFNSIPFSSLSLNKHSQQFDLTYKSIHHANIPGILSLRKKDPHKMNQYIAWQQAALVGWASKDKWRAAMHVFVVQGQESDVPANAHFNFSDQDERYLRWVRITEWFSPSTFARVSDSAGT
jgi:uncharacterized protein involved in tolerance to divalent cations